MLIRVSRTPRNSVAFRQERVGRELFAPRPSPLRDLEARFEAAIGNLPSRPLALNCGIGIQFLEDRCESV